MWIARFGGKQIRLDELNGEREAWLSLSMQGLEGGYGEDEPEYSTDLIKKEIYHGSTRTGKQIY